MPLVVGSPVGRREFVVGVRELFRRFWPFLRRNRAALLLAGTLLVVSALMDTAAIWMFMVLTDDALVTGELAAFWAPAAAWLGIAVMGAIASFCGGFLSAKIAETFLLRLRAHVFEHVQKMPPHFFARHKSGDLIARFSGDVEAVERLVVSGILETVTVLVSVILYAGAALYLRWDLALLSFALAPVFWAVARKFSKQLRAVSTEERAANGAISTVVEEGLSNIELVQAYNQQERQLAKLHAQSLRWFRAKLAEARLSVLYAPLVTVVETICILLVIGLGIWEISAQRITIGGLMAFAAYLGYLYPPLQNLGQITMTVTAARAAAERLIEMLDHRPAVTDDGRRQPPADRHRGIRFERVGFRYPGADRAALVDFDLQVRPGEFVMITGPSGAGKSTLTKLLLRFYDPAAGRLVVDDVNLSELPLQTLRDTITLVPQEVAVLHSTVADNIAFGVPTATRAEIVAAAREADADEFIRGLPEGYDTILGERGALLSGGQRRRIAIARAILRRAPVLVLDEPTNGLDFASTRRVLDPLRRLARSRTTILISHDLDLAAEADRIVVVSGGRVIEQGSHRQLLAGGGHYAKLHGRKSEPPAPLGRTPASVQNRREQPHRGFSGELFGPDETPTVRQLRPWVPI
ncbi:ABC transporter ATP-binding protein [Saccharopolyspora phatthalungensis]|uniref:ATP-binding cassette subfamily B protein n=1 Tax=Saccharopolyspora phatthalungensis TaxID=664693 RepID=A0A840Q6L4_9PSEU|nr:ABC transporter ATP-binding protein [Saccharopolyspora phatthalungensis]MBB5154045.1 ATP-binding cassette subfamily B protein [Saccharopolyspora phatthalungensis]